ncbi:hypothetical protein [Cnuella takakiae]|uniref:hypothetical protein n=1 Tax=Cnuella takakiae TaxID=1302690 RepID=UPI000934940F|nr:hypothetical protein [Cnuella takakiae]OLY90600.1 hypothetical protein BUE76_00775 [Cnuella takakiae]
MLLEKEAIEKVKLYVQLIAEGQLKQTKQVLQFWKTKFQLNNDYHGKQQKARYQRQRAYKYLQLNTAISEPYGFGLADT